MPSPTREPAPRDPPLLHLPSAAPVTGRGSPHRTLRKLASAHNLGYGSAAANLRASVANPPSLIAQQRLHQQHQPPHRVFSPARRNVTTTASALNRSSQRGRANSDAPIVHQLNAAAAAMSSAALRTSAALAGRTAYDHIPLEKLIRDGPPDGDWENALESARLKVLQQEIKSDSDGMVSWSYPIYLYIYIYMIAEPRQLCDSSLLMRQIDTCLQSNLRIYVWLTMLDAPIMRTDDYLDLVHRGASPAYSKIRNDTFRTLTTDPLFRRRVSEASLIRLLNAIAWKLHDSRPQVPLPTRSSIPTTPDGTPNPPHGGYQSHGSSPAAKNRARALTLTTEGSESSLAPEAGTYVQGMNVLAAPFLYAARSESEAFVGFYQLLTKELPGYIRGAMDGVHKGLALVDKVLGIVDPKLSMYLTSKGLSAELYAFPSVLTLSACTPPLPEVLRLWDFLFAYGPHLNIVCIAAQLVIHRDELMVSPK